MMISLATSCVASVDCGGHPLDTYPFQLLEWQTDAILYSNLVPNTTLFPENRNALNLDSILDDAGVVAVHRSRSTLYTSPSTYLAVPTHNGVKNAGIMLDLRILEYDRFLDTHSGSNMYPWSNR